jgi:hypothetical protein
MDSPQSTERGPDIRGLTPAQHHVENILLAAAEAVGDIQKYSDWLSAGAGAAVLAFLSKWDFQGQTHHGVEAIGLGFLVGSLLFGALAKVLSGSAAALGKAKTGAVEIVTRLAHRVSSLEEFQAVLAEANLNIKPRLRLLQRPLTSIVTKRWTKDPLALATLANACAQYLISCVFCQFICIIGGVSLVGLGLFLG